VIKKTVPLTCSTARKLIYSYLTA